MYEAFFGLKTDPFRLTADPAFCFSHRSYIRAKASVQYALHRAEGFVMVTGRPGTGKTTLVGDLVASLPKKKYVVGNLVNNQLAAGELLRMAAFSFGRDGAASRKAHVLTGLIRFLSEKQREGQRALLIVDEAQGLAPSAMNDLSLLSNLQHEYEPLLQILLLGQEDLRTMVHTPQMEPILHRLIAARHLEALTPEETIGYVRHRLETAGWVGDPAIEPGVLPLVYRFSQGIPRRINLICSRLLLFGFLNESHTITAGDAREVMQELVDGKLTDPPDAGSVARLPDTQADIAVTAIRAEPSERMLGRSDPR